MLPLWRITQQGNGVNSANNHWKALLATYASILLLAGNGLFSKSISLSALDITFHRSWIAWIVLAAIVIYQERSLLLASRADYGWGLVIGALLGIHWITYFHAMQVSSVAIGMIALYTYPIITALLEPFFTKSRLDGTDMISTVLVFVGVYLLSPNFDWQDSAFQGLLWGLLSALTFALRNLLQRYRFNQYSAIKSLQVQVLVVVMLLFFFYQAPFPTDYANIDWPLNNFWLLVILGIGFTATPHSLFAFALNNLKAKSVSLIACMQPVFGVLLAFLVLDEIPNLQTMVGGAIILTAAVLETVHVKRQSKQIKADKGR